MSEKYKQEVKEKLDIRFLEIKVEFSKWILAVVFAIVIACYAGQFGDLPISTKPETWGQFGDYVGGILNPLVAFFAFYWLATSVILQKRELADTRKALKDSQSAQQQHADTALLTAKIQTLNIRLSLVSGVLAHQRTRQSAMLELQDKLGPDSGTFDENSKTRTIKSALVEINAEVDRLIRHEDSLLHAVEALAGQLAPEFNPIDRN